MKRAWTLLERLLHPPKWVLPLLRLFRKAKENRLHRLTGTVFGGKYIGDPAFRGGVSIRRMNAITGGGVWFSVILIAVTMLLHSRKMKEVNSVDPLGE